MLLLSSILLLLLETRMASRLLLAAQRPLSLLACTLLLSSPCLLPLVHDALLTPLFLLAMSMSAYFLADNVTSITSLGCRDDVALASVLLRSNDPQLLDAGGDLL